MLPNEQQSSKAQQTPQQTVNPPAQPGSSMPSQPASSVNPSIQPSKSHVGLIIGIVVAVIVLVLGIAGAYLFFFSDSAVSKRTSNSFMSAMTTGDVASALKYTDGSSDTQAFLNSMKDGMQGQYKLKESASGNGTYYYLYSLTGASNQAARTELSKVSGDWQVNALYTGGENLAVKAQASSNEQEVSEQPTQTDPSICLVQSDFDEWYKSEYGSTATENGFNFHKPENMYTTNFKFQSDSLEYNDSAYNEGNVSSIANLAKSVQGKTYTIRLEGSVATTAQADLDFATKRAEKVKADLVAQGVPANKISIEQPGNVDDVSDPSRRDEVTKQASRNVVVKFDPTCSGSNSDGTAR